MINKENNVLIYQDENGITKVAVRFVDEDLWLTQPQIAELYDTTQQNISQHIENIYSDEELDREATNKKFLLVRTEGSRQVRRNIDHYNLDMIIALGYRVQSQIATRFRRWATVHLHEFIQKGFAMDDERLKQGGSRYFRELLQRIRDIRASERNFYQQVTDIYATATDYDPRSDLTKAFFSTIQNKLQRLNLLVSQFLDFAEFQALEQVPMTMKDWIDSLDNQIVSNHRKLLEGKGNISHKQAITKAEREFNLYRAREMQQLESDFDRAVKQLNNMKNGQGNENQ